MRISMTFDCARRRTIRNTVVESVKTSIRHHIEILIQVNGHQVTAQYSTFTLALLATPVTACGYTHMEPV